MQTIKKRDRVESSLSSQQPGSDDEHEERFEFNDQQFQMEDLKMQKVFQRKEESENKDQRPSSRRYADDDNSDEESQVSVHSEDEGNYNTHRALLKDDQDEKHQSRRKSTVADPKIVRKSQKSQKTQHGSKSKKSTR